MSATQPAATTDVEQLSIDTIRTLAMDAVQHANSGHPGAPMALAPAAYLLYTKFMRHNPKNPEWPDRDRFVLSAGHASMLLYAALHLSGYDLTMDDLKQFRQWGSKTPGHPERDRVHVTPGVEVTTGPLGQGFANGVGMAMAERFLRERYGEEVMDHRTFAIVSDGDLMEGISAESASLAGHLALGRLVYLYDDNHISLDGPTSLSFEGEDVEARFRAYRWHTLHVDDINDLSELSAAIQAGIDEQERPTLIRCRTIIGWPAPNKQNTSKAHGAPLGEDEVRATKEILGWDPDKHFYVPDAVYGAFDQTDRGRELEEAWEARFATWREANPDAAREWDIAWSARPEPGLDDVIPTFDPAEKDAIATRSAGQVVMEAFREKVPTMVGGAADLTESTKTIWEEEEIYDARHAGRNVFFGVREHSMGAEVNGMAAHGGIVRPFGSTFLQFSDYMRPPIRLSALMGLHSTFVYTHDSVGLGEDGPTHQPVEHFMALRAIPELTVIRPADANETAQGWRTILEDLDGPAVLILSRQNLPVLDQSKYGSAKGLARGAYVLREAGAAAARLVLLGTGSEVSVAMAAADRLEADGVPTRVVSFPCWELFEQQDGAYRDEVLPPGVPRVSIEAGITLGWERWADRSVGINRFGASAPGEIVLDKLGINVDNLVKTAKDLLG
ncbi:MAG: tkt [Solirubrobacterales bacterium]|nr:tkt [Solirubrobacterales bacterium]